MKIIKNKVFTSILLASFILCLTVFSGCSDNSAQAPEETTTAAVTEAPTTAPPDDENFDLNLLHTFDKESDDPFAGVWHITDGQGKQYENFAYMFDGNEGAYLFSGNTGYFGKYSLDTDESGEKTFTSQLMFGINGVYTFEFSEGNKKLVLHDTETMEDTMLEKLESYSPLPSPDENPVIDKNILGAWASDDGDYVYFDKSGIMYQNLYNTMFTYSAYSAIDGKITANYFTGTEDATDEFTYSVKGETLTLNKFEYRKIPVSELK